MTRKSGNAAGMLRDGRPPADLPILCKQPAHAELFEKVIDILVEPTHALPPGSSYVAKHVAAAKKVCLGDPETGTAACPVRLMCLEHHGRDLRLGVVGGLTDGERAQVFGVGVA